MHAVRLAVRENVLHSASVTEASYVSALEESGRGWVVEVDREVIAFAVGNRVTGNIWALFVHPEHEGQGHGRTLHDVMLEWLFAQGVRRAWLSTEPGTRAQRFYERAGWHCTGVLPGGEVSYEYEGGNDEVTRDGLSEEPFSFRETADGRVRISYHGKVVTTLAGPEADRFRRRSAGADDRTLQLLMAKATGNFKRGNERAR